MALHGVHKIRVLPVFSGKHGVRKPGPALLSVGAHAGQNDHVFLTAVPQGLVDGDRLHASAVQQGIVPILDDIRKKGQRAGRPEGRQAFFQLVFSKIDGPPGFKVRRPHFQLNGGTEECPVIERQPAGQFFQHIVEAKIGPRPAQVADAHKAPVPQVFHISGRRFPAQLPRNIGNGAQGARRHAVDFPELYVLFAERRKHPARIPSPYSTALQHQTYRHGIFSFSLKFYSRFLFRIIITLKPSKSKRGGSPPGAKLRREPGRR